MTFHWSERKIRALKWALFFSLIPSLATLLLFPDFSSWERIAFALRQGVAAALLVVTGLFLYHLSARHFLTPATHPLRYHLVYLWSGTALALGCLTLGYSIETALLAGIMVNIGITLIVGHRLFWDALFASLGLGILYIVTTLITSKLLPSPLDDLWLSYNTYGTLLLTLPLRQIIILGGLGMLWGPLFSYLKEPKEKSSLTTPTTFYSRHLNIKTVVASLILLCALIGGSWFSYIYLFKSQSVSAQMQDPKAVPLNSEVLIQFSRPIAIQDVRLSITPPVEGSWEMSNTALGNRTFQSLAFKPTEVFLPDQEYTILVEDSKKIIGANSETHRIAFHSEQVPKILTVTPPTGSTVQACTSFAVQFEHPLSSYWEPEFIITPSTELEITHTEARYTLTPKNCLEQGTGYTLSAAINIRSAPKTEPAALSTFQTVTAPGLTTHAPQGDQVLVTTSSIDIGFSKKMNTENPANFARIEPAVAGTWRWNTEGTMLSYIPSTSLAHATRYTATILKGISDQDGGILEKDVTISFTTIGHATIIGASPSPNSKNLGIGSSIQITFNQPVETKSAESHFTITPPIAGNFSWNNRTLTFKPTQELSYSTTYTVSVSKGVEAVHGLELQNTYTTSFSTKAAPIPPATPVTLGFSEQGRAINGFIFGSGKNVIFIHGGIHSGKERSNVTLLERLVREINVNKSLVGDDKTIIIVPNANPDASATRSDKYNSREVNLNINFDTVGWVPFGVSEEAPNAGPEPFSEKESRVIRDITLKYKPSTMVAFHSKGRLINPEYGHAPSQDLAKQYARLSGYAYYDSTEWDYPGTATKWFLENTGGASITVELASHSVADWSNHQEALYTLIK